MTTAKKLGIWMDHSSAHFTEFTTNPDHAGALSSEFTDYAKEHTVGSSENTMHNKGQQHQSEFYKSIGDTIKNYEEVILFGPTDAKVELYNLLKDDHHFQKIKIEVKQTDKMSENQQHAYVLEHFSNH